MACVKKKKGGQKRFDGYSATLTNSYSTRDKLLSSFTVKLAGSVASIRPHLSTASLIDPLNMSILALRKITVASGFSKSTWSLRAVNTMTPVSSPTRHSAMRGAR
nr:unknown [Zea mays]